MKAHIKVGLVGTQDTGDTTSKYKTSTETKASGIQVYGKPSDTSHQLDDAEDTTNRYETSSEGGDREDESIAFHLGYGELIVDSEAPVQETSETSIEYSIQEAIGRNIHS
ncbi:hypothetical protein P3T76_008163 [Phytophthora citrophthora]|uniref:Uncharacterized protein n=1 Tax=Phytophthora citrophthora TaxID=4793 RepID=A0AAD9GLG4_9STRA|nr:hypothetical protein P3T76_008163 [Phytophthora citrophthora]